MRKYCGYYINVCITFSNSLKSLLFLFLFILGTHLQFSLYRIAGMLRAIKGLHLKAKSINIVTYRQEMYYLCVCVFVCCVCVCMCDSDKNE